MIELIAEHHEGKVTVRATVNDNLIVSYPFNHLLDAINNLHTAVFDFEGVDLFKTDFTVKQEFV